MDRGILAGLFEKREVTLSAELWRSIGSLGTRSGVTITADSALRSTAVFRCVKILADTLAMLPLNVYRRLSPGGKEFAFDHPLYSVLHDVANPEMSSYTWRNLIMGHAALRGNGYSEIVYNSAGDVTELWPLNPAATAPWRDANNAPWYDVELPEAFNRAHVKLPAWKVLHIKGFSTGFGMNGLVGLSPIALAREAVGLAQATEAYGSAYFGNGANPGVALTHPGKVSPTGVELMKKSWNDMHQGLDNAHRVAILQEGVTIERIGIAPEDSQFLETRKFQVTEIARLFGVPPHMVGDLDRATFSNIEHQSIEFVTNTMLPWLTNWEQEIGRSLFAPAERKRYFARFNVNGLLRGDFKSRADAYAIMRQNGAFSVNDILELEDRNTIGPEGDIRLVPLNMVPLDQFGQEPTAPTVGAPTTTRDILAAWAERELLKTVLTEDVETMRLASGQTNEGGERGCGGLGAAKAATTESSEAAHDRATGREERARNIGKGRLRLAKSYERIFRDASARVINREIADVRRAVKKYFGKRSNEEFLQWLQDFYQEHREFWTRAILPVLLTYADAVGVSVGEEIGVSDLDSARIRTFIDGYVADLAASESQSSFLQLRRLLLDAVPQEPGIGMGADPDADLETLLNTRLDEWEQTRADKTAERESRNSMGAFAIAFYGASRIVQRTLWVNIGDSCAFCVSLDGKTCSIEEYYVGKGQELSGEGDATLSKRTNIRHPPIHGGCDCMVVADL